MYHVTFLTTLKIFSGYL